VIEDDAALMARIHTPDFLRATALVETAVECASTGA